MGAAYSQDLRDRVLSAYRRGMKTIEIAEVFEVSPAWARRIKQRLREGGETSPRKVGSPGVRKIDPERLAELVRKHPDATLGELREMLGNVCGQSAISAALRKLGLSFKERRSTRPSRSDPTSPSGVKTGRTISPASTPGG
jgi:transposase